MQNVPAGYSDLHNGAAWLDLSARGKIQATGEDRARLLHAMTTNQVQELKPGSGCYAYFLSAQGRILADVNLLCRPDHFLLDTEPETREKIFRHIDAFIIADDVTLQDVTDSFATLALEGPASSTVLEAIGAPVPEAEMENREWNDALVVRTSSTGGAGFYFITPIEQRGRLIGLFESEGAKAAAPEAFRIVRIENGRPRYGEDISERYLAQEVNQQRALNFSKGCYLGQEIVERVRSRGQVHRVLVPVRIEGRETPAPGTRLQAPDGSEAAEVTSSVFSPALGKVAALAYVRVAHARPGVELSLAGRQATVVEV